MFQHILFCIIYTKLFHVIFFLFSVKKEDCGLNFPDDFKAEVGDLKFDPNCDFGGGKFLKHNINLSSHG